MFIKIEKGHDPKLKIPRFVCDKRLKEGVPAPYHLLVDGFRFIAMTGRPQSGKTSHMLSLFNSKKCLKKCWNHVILCCPQESLASLASGDNVFADLHPSQMFTDISDIDVIREMIKLFAAEGESSVLIIDDQTARLKSAAVQKTLADIIFNRRHYKCSVIILVQIYNSLPLMIRKLINVAMIQYKPSKKEMETICEELLEHNQETALAIGRAVFQQPYDFMLIDVPSQTIFRKYDRLIIEDEAKTA